MKHKSSTVPIVFRNTEIVIRCVTPKERTSDAVTIVVPGWGETPDTLRGFIDHMASMGGVVYSFAHPRHVSNEVGSEQALKAKELLQVIHFLGCKRVNIVAHSEAAVNVVLAAREKPHLFGKLILVAPSGLVGGSSYACHLTRFGLHLTRVFLQLLRRDYTVKAWQILKDMGVYLAANPARALREAKEIAGACIISDLEEIARHGVEVEVFVQLSDLAYKASRIQEELAGLDIQVHMVQGGHSQICLNPEEISV